MFRVFFQKWPIFANNLKSRFSHSNQLAAWFISLRRRLRAQKSWVQIPNSSKKWNKTLKFYQAIRNQNQFFHGFNPEKLPKLRVMNFARDFAVPKLRVWKKLPKFIPKIRLSGNRRISRSFGRKWITVQLIKFNFDSREPNYFDFQHNCGLFLGH